MRIVAGLDVGTTGAKISLYDEQAALLCTYYTEYDVSRQAGKQEMDFACIAEGVKSLLGKAARQYEITALGVTSFGETFCMLDRDDNILAPSILYTDPRGEEESRLLREAVGEWEMTLLTGVKPHGMYSISKILWHKRNTPELFAACDKILLGEDFIVYTLTGQRRISHSLAARTGAFDIEKKCWAEPIFEAAGVDSSLLSTPASPGEIIGKLREGVKQELGIDYDILVVSACHDQVANMIGSGIFEDTQAMDGTGTVECVPVVLRSKPQDPAFYEGGYSVVPYFDGTYACYAFSFTGGATIKWFRDRFAELEAEQARKEGKNVYAELDRRVKDGPTGLLVLPHFSGAATPYMDTASRAAIVGLTLENDKMDLYKALMEGTSYEMLINFNALKEHIGKIREIRATGGGATSDVWLQIKADILEREITALDVKEVGAAGVALLVGQAIGIYRDIRKTSSLMAPVRRVFTPNPQVSEVYRALYRKYKNLYRAVKSL